MENREGRFIVGILKLTGEDRFSPMRCRYNFYFGKLKLTKLNVRNIQ